MSMPSERRVPQDDRFYFLFQQLAQKAVAVAERFRRLLDEYDTLDAAVTEIRLLEHDADVLVLELEARLNAARVTPFEASDIHTLTGRLDDVVDRVEATADRLMLYQVAGPNEPLVALSDALVRCVHAVDASVRALGHGSRDQVAHHCHLINEHENAADQILREALRDLFSGRYEALDVLKWKEIYDLIEGATDACEDVADVIETIALKRA